MFAEIVATILGFTGGPGLAAAGSVAAGVGGNLLTGPVRRAIEAARGSHNDDLEAALAAAFLVASERLAKARQPEVRMVAERLRGDAERLFPAGEDRRERSMLPAQEAEVGGVLDALLMGDEVSLRAALARYLAGYLEGDDAKGEIEARLPIELGVAFGDVLKDEQHRRAWIAFQRDVLQRTIAILRDEMRGSIAEQREELNQLVRSIEALLLNEERLAALVMETLTAVREGDQRILDELAAMGRELRAVIAARLVAAPVPCQLPYDIGDFEGRVVEIGTLSGRLEQASKGLSTEVVISAVAGMGGVGKSTLAVHVAWRVAWMFPDGQLYVDLRGVDGKPRETQGVLEEFLGALGVEAGAMPLDLSGRAGLYRSRLAGKRVLVLLDNAKDERQVRPLLPGMGGCAALVTSRARLSALEGATTLDLEVMTPDDARALLTRLVGKGRVQAEPEAIERIVGLCARLPLALRIAGGQLGQASRRRWSLERYARRLADERRRLDRLTLGDKDVRATFALSYDELSETEQRLFRLLGAPAGPDFGAPIVAALLEVDEEEAEETLGRLVDAQLVRSLDNGRYQLHDLLRLFARERSAGAGTEAEEARKRACTWYVRVAIEMDSLRDPLIRRSRAMELSAQSDGDIRGMSDRLEEESLVWFDSELQGILATIRQEEKAGDSDAIVRLAMALVRFFSLRGHWDEWERSQHTAVAAAEKSGDVALKAVLLNALGALHNSLHRSEAAVDAYQEALDIWKSIGDNRGAAQTLGNLGAVYESQRRWADAESCCRESLALFQEQGDRLGEAQAHGSLGNLSHRLGKWDEAEREYGDSLAIFIELSDRLGEGQILGNLGLVYKDQNRAEKALKAFQRSLEIKRSLGDRPGEAKTHNNLGLAYASGHAWDEAIASFEGSLELKRDIGDYAGEGETLGNLAGVYMAAGRLSEAAIVSGRVLAIMRSLGDRFSVGQALYNLARVLQDQGCCDDAISAYVEGLDIFRTLDERSLEGRTLDNLCVAYGSQGRWGDAVVAGEQSVKVKRALGDRSSLGKTLSSLGVVYKSKGQYGDAIAGYQEGLDIFRSLQDLRSEAEILTNLGNVYAATGQPQKAMSSYGQGLAIMRVIGEWHGEGLILSNLAAVYESHGNSERALEIWREALTSLRGESSEYARLAAFLDDHGVDR